MSVSDNEVNLKVKGIGQQQVHGSHWNHHHLWGESLWVMRATCICCHGLSYDIYIITKYTIIANLDGKNVPDLRFWLRSLVQKYLIYMASTHTEYPPMADNWPRSMSKLGNAWLRSMSVTLVSIPTSWLINTHEWPALVACLTTNSQLRLDGPSTMGNCQVSWRVNNGVSHWMGCKIGYMYLDDSFFHLKGIQWSYI
jgi:hypothetical protein